MQKKSNLQDSFALRNATIKDIGTNSVRAGASILPKALITSPDATQLDKTVLLSWFVSGDMIKV